MAADFNSLSKNEKGALVAGGLATLLTFFSAFLKVSYDGGKGVPGLNFSSGASAWHGYATFGVLLVVAATAIVAIKAFAKDSLPEGVPWSLAAFGAAALGLLLLILYPLTKGGGGLGISVGPGWSAYLLWIAAAALTFFTFTMFQESGDKMPEMKRDNPPSPPAPPAA